MNFNTLVEQSLHHVQCRRKTNVVGTGFKRETQQRDTLAFNHPKSFINFSKEAVNSLLIDALGGLQNFEINSNGGSQADERLNVLWKAEAPKAKPCLQKLCAYTRIESHCVRHFLNVCTKFFAQVGNGIRVTDFQREK